MLDGRINEKHSVALDIENMSKAEILSKMAHEEREAFYKTLTPEESELLLYDWSFWGRPKQQIPPGDWFAWLIMGGRGFGKTRTGAETIREWQNQGFDRFALIGQTVADVRDVMLHGESGLITISPKHNKPVYIASRRQVEWPNGARAFLYSGDEPEQLRGPQHQKGWLDEIVKFKYLEECLDMFELGLRIGLNPQYLATTTPKSRPALKKMVADDATHLTTGSSFENLGNLSSRFIERVIKKYEGTRLGRQELYAELFTDVAGALWTYDLIERTRVRTVPEDLVRIAVALDPSTTNNNRSAEAGIITAGLSKDGHCYIMYDDSLKAHVSVWSGAAVRRYKDVQADIMIGEANNGGDLIEALIQTHGSGINYQKVHAARGKFTRAEPVAALHEKGVIHIVGELPELETELAEWVPGEDSPNRLDAMVWAVTALMLDEDESGLIRPIGRFM